ncbi:MAG: hypothetical protein SFV15_02135 [Polyangiaceae bacterium]|nr:hypothetical protein [Polyangiaceae bacterium]
MDGWERTPGDTDSGLHSSVGLRIGGITLGFVHGEHAEIVMPGAFSAFQTQSPADLQLEVRRVSEMPKPPSEVPLFDSGGSWKLFKEASGGLMFACHTPAFGHAPYQVARVDRTFTYGEVLLDERRFPHKERIAGLEYPLGELLLEHLLCSRQGIELHASGLITEDGRGYIFTAQSGGGKTTMSRIWQNAKNVRILSDDRIVLRLSEGKVIMHGTPWHGEGAFSEAGSVPVTALYFLRQTHTNQAFRMESSLAVARLLSTSFVPFYDKALMGECLETLERVVECVPTYELGFVPDAHVVDFVLNHST